MKSFSTVRDIQRGSQSYMEKRRGRKETEVARRIKGESKGERQIQPVISSLSVLHFSIGEGNGHPLQYSCLANPMDGGGW